MKRPLSGPPATRNTGAYGPKPEIPSWTITPLVTATSTALGPHAPPLVEMSTPWSGDQLPGGAATDLGTIGNTNPWPAPSEFSSWTIFSSRLTSASDGGCALGSPTGSRP